MEMSYTCGKPGQGGFGGCSCTHCPIRCAAREGVFFFGYILRVVPTSYVYSVVLLDTVKQKKNEGNGVGKKAYQKERVDRRIDSQAGIRLRDALTSGFGIPARFPELAIRIGLCSSGTAR